MPLKSKYRQAFKDGGRINQPGQDEPIEQPIEAVSAAPEAPAPTVDEPPAPPQPEPQQPEQPQQNDATLALKRQIDDLRASEERQRQQAAQAAMPQQPMTREQRLAEWQQHGGLSNAEIQFFQKHPEMVDFPQITGLAVSQAKQAGHERGTDAHFAFVEKAFNARVEHLMREQAQAGASMTPTAPTPAFFKPPPGASRSAPTPASLVSAPVSRTIPAGGPRPKGKVTLTPTEVEAARVSGVSIEEYARQKAKYEGMRETGEYRDGRDPR